MISLPHLNNLKKLVFFFVLLIFNDVFAADPVDIWKKQEGQNLQNKQSENKIEQKIKSPILSGDVNKIVVEINEQTIEKDDQTVIGIYDPEENNFTLDMWSQTDGKDIKNVLKRINKLKLSKLSEDLLSKVLLTNAYPPKDNLSSKEFLKIKIDWLIKNRKLRDLEILLSTNPEVGKETNAIIFLINEYLSSAKIKLACEKISFINQNIQNDYLDKFTVYCLINDNREEEAQMLLDLLNERGMNDKFFEDKIAYLMGYKDETSQKIKDDNLLNFYLSHITINSFNYEPDEKTDKYIWRYLSSANLIKIKDIEDENVITTYEKAAEENSFKSEEVFNIYKQILFSVDQLINSTEVYKNMPGYKARALIYQSMLLSDDAERKLYLAFLLKDLFNKDKLTNVYLEELSNILQNINISDIPENYSDLVKQNLEKNKNTKKIQFDNEILHRSKILKHFLEDNEKIKRTEKDFKSVYKKIKRNKKYFVSIKDIIVLESLVVDGVSVPKDLNYADLSSQLTVPQNLSDLAEKKQTGLVMLKIIEIIGEDNVESLDPETIYFLNRILNDLNLKKIRNNILSEALPVRV